MAELRRRNGPGPSAGSAQTPADEPARDGSPVIETAKPTESDIPASGSHENTGNGCAFKIPHLEILETRLQLGKLG